MTSKIHQTEIDYLNKKKLYYENKENYNYKKSSICFCQYKRYCLFPVPVLNSYLKCTSAIHYTKLLDTTLLYTSLNYTAL